MFADDYNESDLIVLSDSDVSFVDSFFDWRLPYLPPMVRSGVLTMSIIFDDIFVVPVHLDPYTNFLTYD